MHRKTRNESMPQRVQPTGFSLRRMLPQCCGASSEETIRNQIARNNLMERSADESSEPTEESANGNSRLRNEKLVNRPEQKNEEPKPQNESGGLRNQQNDSMTELTNEESLAARLANAISKNNEVTATLVNTIDENTGLTGENEDFRNDKACLTQNIGALKQKNILLQNHTNNLKEVAIAFGRNSTDSRAPAFVRKIECMQPPPNEETREEANNASPTIEEVEAKSDASPVKNSESSGKTTSSSLNESLLGTNILTNTDSTAEPVQSCEFKESAQPEEQEEEANFVMVADPDTPDVNQNSTKIEN